MKADEALIIVGASARAAAFSALRAGLRPWCADLFADVDLRQHCPVERVPVERYPEGLPHALESMPPGPWMYTGALENQRKIVRRLCALRPLWGNRARVLKPVRSPFAVKAVCNHFEVPAPAVCRASKQPWLNVPWLLKPLAGAGGRGIRHWRHGDDRPSDTGGWFFQEFVDGTECAAVFLGDGRRARLLGVTRQLVGAGWLHAAPFHYSGSIGPMPLPPDAENGFSWLGQALVEGFSLRGLFGVDCVLKKGVPWPVEINPRYTASVEVLEYATGLTALALHQRVFEAAVNQPPVQQPRPPNGVVGKAVVFAPTACRFHADGPWRDALRLATPVTQLPAFADIPAPGEVIAAGWPALTCFARAETEEACLQALQQTAKDLDRWLFRQ